jgi:glycosyltransferase involved in cell wall biosynthesis
MSREAPSVSVVIPTLNSAKYLEECLGSVRSQAYAGRVEVVIVDAGSTDDTLDIAHRFGAERILENPLKTGEAGKAVGLRAAAGDLLLSLDSDNVVVGSDWLRRMVEPFFDPDVVAAQPLRWDYRRQVHHAVGCFDRRGGSAGAVPRKLRPLFLLDG